MPSSSQPLLLLNRQLSGMYRRTNNISLNAPSPLSTTPPQQADPSAAADPTASTSSLPRSFDSPSGEALSSLLSALPAQDQSTPGSPSATLSSSTTTKRKLRPSKDPSTPKRPKPTSSAGVPATHAPPATRLADLGGVDKCVESMLELVALPL